MAADAPSRVTWELDAAGPGITKVTMVHEELVAGSETESAVTRGWSYVLSGLKSVLETGEPLGRLG